jgi:hypothetical protein
MLHEKDSIVLGEKAVEYRILTDNSNGDFFKNEKNWDDSEFFLPV